jgi:hypothetical protein
MLQSFNRIEDPRTLRVGKSLEIPLIDLRLVAPPPSPPRPVETETAAATAGLRPSPTRTAKTPTPEPGAVVQQETNMERAEPPSLEPPTPEWFSDGYDAAVRAFRDGDFETADTSVRKLVARTNEIPRERDRARLWQLCAFVDIAFDRRDDACAAYRSMRETGAEVALDPDEVSPKIRDLLESCDAESTIDGPPAENPS